MSSILGLLLAGAVISTAIKVGVLVVGVKAYRARRRHNEAQADALQTEETPDFLPAQSDAAASTPD